MPAATPTRERRATGPGSGAGDSPWRVIVRNDDHNTFQGVALALSQTLPGVGYGQGMAYAERIHTRGSALVFSGHRELAEHYHGRLAGFGLTLAPLERG